MGLDGESSFPSGNWGSDHVIVEERSGVIVVREFNPKTERKSGKFLVDLERNHLLSRASTLFIRESEIIVDLDG